MFSPLLGLVGGRWDKHHHITKFGDSTEAEDHSESGGDGSLDWEWLGSAMAFKMLARIRLLG